MSSSTGIRKRRTPEDRIDEAIDGVGDAYLRKARRYSDKAFSQGGALGTGPIYGSINPGTNSLQTSGGAMIGSIAFNPILVGVVDGRINIEPGQNERSKASSYVLVTGEGTPDDLRFIDGADKNGQYLILQATLSQILVLKAATLSIIATISGLGTVTVVTTSEHNMVTGDKANILDTDNFDISDVTVTKINATTFTYSAIGSIFPETTGTVQNGNIVTPDGNDVILNAAVSPNGIPVVTLIFDPTVVGFGAWRLVSVSVTTGGTGTSFPILYPKQDIDPGAGITQTIDLSIITGNAKQIQFPADNIGLAIVGDPVNTVAEDVYVMFIQDSVGGRTLSEIDPRIVNRALINGLINPNPLAKTLFRFATLDGGLTYFAILIDLVTGGAVVEFPITPPVQALGVVFTTQNINLAINTAHSTTLTLGADIDITFSGFPLAETQIEWEVEITQDGTTPFVITWPLSVVNPPSPSAYAILDSITIVVFRTNDAGATIRVGNTVTTTVSGGDVSNWAFFPAKDDIDFATFDGINIDRLIFSQSAGEVLTSDVIGITSDTAGNFLTNAVGEYQWLVDANLKMQLNASQLTMSANIDMSNNSLFDATEIGFDITNLFNPTTLTIIGFDSSSFGLRYNAGDTTTNHQFEIAGEPMVIINRLAANRGSLATEQLIAEELLDLSTFTNTTPLNGNIWLDDTTGLFQFQQNNVTVGLVTSTENSIIDGNSSLTILDDAAPSRLRIVFDGDGANPEWLWFPTSLQIQSNTTNFVQTIIRNTSPGEIGNIIATIENKGFDDDVVTPELKTYYTSFSQIASPVDGVENGKWTYGVLSKGSAITNYILEGGAGIINNNSLHSFFGSMFLKSEQDGDEAVFRLERNDSETQNNDVIGIINFRAQNNLGTVTPYGSIEMQIEGNTNAAEIGRFVVKLLDNGITTSQLLLSQGSLTVNKTTTTATESPILNLIREDTSPGINDVIGSLRFRIFDDPTTTTYSQIQCTLEDSLNAATLRFDVRSNNTLLNAMVIEGNVSSNKYQFLLGGVGPPRIQPASATGTMGYFVTAQVEDFSLNIGNSGTIEIPTIANGNPSVTELNSAFGSFDRAMGIDTTEFSGGGDPAVRRLYVRLSASEWIFFEAAGSVT